MGRGEQAKQQSNTGGAALGSGCPLWRRAGGFELLLGPEDGLGMGRSASVCVGPGGTVLCWAAWAAAALLALCGPKSAAYIHNCYAHRPPELEGISQRAHF